MNKPRFNPKTPGKTTSLIVMYYRFSGHRIAISTGLNVLMKHWDPRKMRVKNVASYPEADLINSQLDHYELSCREVIRDLIKEKGVLTKVQPEEFKSAMLLKVGKAQTTASNRFITYLDKFIADRQKQPHKYSRGSILVYNSFRMRWLEFAGSKHFDLSELDKEVLKSFQTRLFEKNFSSTYVDKLWRTMKSVLNAAEEEKLTVNQDFKSKSLRLEKVPVDNIYLTEEELRSMYDLDLSKDPPLEKVRDTFIVGSYTGLRYGDLQSLTLKNLTRKDGKDYLTVFTGKTNTKVVIPVHPYVRALLTKYKGDLPSMSNQKTNVYLKKVAEKASILDQITVRRHAGGTRTEETLVKYELVTSHTARRSFATNAYKSGIDISSIMKITGHSTEAVFKNYIKVGEEENAEKLSESRFFENSTQ
ncbi:MAG: tyrosine-type recombinase/integrase [Saprospiraceae bacterium]